MEGLTANSMIGAMDCERAIRKQVTTNGLKEIKKPAVHDSLDKLEKTLCFARDSLDRLSTQISPVLEPAPTGGTTGESMASASCPLDSRIVSLTTMAADVAREINHICDRVRV